MWIICKHNLVNFIPDHFHSICVHQSQPGPPSGAAKPKRKRGDQTHDADASFSTVDAASDGDDDADGRPAKKSRGGRSGGSTGRKAPHPKGENATNGEAHERKKGNWAGGTCGHSDTSTASHWAVAWRTAWSGSHETPCCTSSHHVALLTHGCTPLHSIPRHCTPCPYCAGSCHHAAAAAAQSPLIASKS